jgi:hypothetical protein
MSSRPVEGLVDFWGMKALRQAPTATDEADALRRARPTP